MFAYCGNNPVNCYDPSGCCGICLSNKTDNQFSFTQGCCSGYGVSGGGGAGLLLLSETLYFVEDAAALVISAIAVLRATTQKGTQHVYILTDPKNDDVVKYVGRTNDPARRWNEHKNDPKHPERKAYTMEVIASGLTLEQAKVVEQVAISAFTLGYLENARREIALGKIDRYHQYIGAAAEIFAGATENALWRLIGG